MPKPITEKHTKSIVGTLNVDNMSVELEQIGIQNLSDLFAKFNGQYVTINISLKSEPEE